MGMINQACKFVMGFILVVPIVLSCASVPSLNVTYRLPTISEDLKGRRVFLAIEDTRSAKEIIGAGAKEDFKSFPGNVSFSLARGNEPGFKIGPYDVPSLFKEAFKRTLEGSGAEVVAVRKKGQVEVVIVLKDFLLNLIGRKWVVNIEYEAQLVRDGRLLSKQTISGQAERIKVIGKSQADDVVGEIFTDTVNKLDVARLFKQAGL
ncbi:MAG: hypothetical protein ABII26_07770 [Pseudomonadota bacterium]